MKQTVFYALALLLLGAGAARAQGVVEAREDVVFTTNDPTEKAQKLSFGFGSDFTDSTDFDKGEQILPPFFPPDGFFVFFSVRDKFGSEDFATMDVRGVPDSVKAGQNFFSQTWLMRLQRYRGQDVSITFAFPLRRGIDSVVFESTQPGANFRAVFTDRGTQKIPNPLITTLKMTVYYNFDRAAAVPLNPVAAGRSLRMAPNPVHRGASVALADALPGGAQITVSDVRGRAIRSWRVGEAGGVETLTTADLPAGAYFLRALGSDGLLLGTDRLIVSE